jgi:hypothetical protein
VTEHRAELDPLELERAVGNALFIESFLRRFDELEPRTDLAEQFIAALQRKAEADLEP